MSHQNHENTLQMDYNLGYLPFVNMIFWKCVHERERGSYYFNMFKYKFCSAWLVAIWFGPRDLNVYQNMLFKENHIVKHKHVIVG